MSMTKLSIGIVALFITQSILIIGTKFNIWPEIYFFSWLVGKGLIPYKDFFDHHGPALYYLFAPLSSYLSIYPMVYLLIRSVNLIIFLKIQIRNTTKIGLLLGSSLYVFLSYFFSENNLWYETIITTIYLLIAYLIGKQSYIKFKTLLISILIVLVTLIKPTSLIVALPVLILTKNIRLLILLVVEILIVTSVLSIFVGVPNVLNVFSFNRFLLLNYHPNYISDVKLLILIMSFTLSSLFILLVSKSISKTTFSYFLFMLSSLIFLQLGYSRSHVLPSLTFAILIISKSISFTSKVNSVYSIVILVFTLLVFGKSLAHYNYLANNRIEWLNDLGATYAVEYLRNKNIQDKQLFVIGNHLEIYIKLNALPPTRYPFKFPMIANYNSDYESIVITELTQNKVCYVVISMPIQDVERISKVYQYVVQNYNLIEKTINVEIYENCST